MRVTFFHYFFYDKIFFSQLKQVQIFVTKNVNNNFDTCFSTYIRVVCFVVIFFFIKKNINTLYEICFQISAVCFMQLWKKGCMRLIRFLATIFVVDFAALLEKKYALCHSETLPPEMQQNLTLKNFLWP